MDPGDSEDCVVNGRFIDYREFDYFADVPHIYWELDSVFQYGNISSKLIKGFASGLTLLSDVQKVY